MAATKDEPVRIGSAEALGLARFTDRIAADVGLRGPLSDVERHREMMAMEGITAPILARLRENEIETLDDLAGCATDDLTGWFERNALGDIEAEHAGILEGLDVSRADCDRLILRARTTVGLIDGELVVEGDVALRLGPAEAFGVSG